MTCLFQTYFDLKRSCFISRTMFSVFMQLRKWNNWLDCVLLLSPRWRYAAFQRVNTIPFLVGLFCRIIILNTNNWSLNNRMDNGPALFILYVLVAVLLLWLQWNWLSWMVSFQGHMPVHSQVGPVSDGCRLFVWTFINDKRKPFPQSKSKLPFKFDWVSVAAFFFKSQFFC